MTKCSRNLRKHLQLLKQECNEIVTLHNNEYKVETEQLANYLTHKRYVTELLHSEKMKSYDTMFRKASKKLSHK